MLSKEVGKSVLSFIVGGIVLLTVAGIGAMFGSTSGYVTGYEDGAKDIGIDVVNFFHENCQEFNEFNFLGDSETYVCIPAVFQLPRDNTTESIHYDL